VRCWTCGLFSAFKRLEAQRRRSHDVRFQGVGRVSTRPGALRSVHGLSDCPSAQLGAKDNA